MMGPPIYAAPEVYSEKEENYDHKIDVWSAGLILHEMLKGGSARAHIKVHVQIFRFLPIYANSGMIFARERC